MTRIGIISDTHGYWDERYAKHFSEVDEIWHLGDIGTMQVADRLAALHPLRAVWGNADGQDLRKRFTETLRFHCEDVDVVMKHIGGHPGAYHPSIVKLLKENPPQLLVCGHSHILRVIYDKRFGLLHINPGAAGLQGWQQVRTLLRLVIDGSDIRDLEVIHLSGTNARKE